MGRVLQIAKNGRWLVGASRFISSWLARGHFRTGRLFPFCRALQDVRHFSACARNRESLIFDLSRYL